ncbi:MAG: hypothetical protein WD708_04115 [Kiritimatiellia bacterium]
MKPSTTPSAEKDPCKGSALLLTLLVVSLLMVITLAFTVYIRFESRSVLNHQHQQQARKNANLGLQLAIADLQFHTGPDQRVTGTANQSIPESATISPSTSGSEARNSLNAFWRARRNPHWTGAWHNSNTSSFDRNSPADYQAIPELRSWLVGRGPGMANLNPETPVDDLNPNSTAYDLLTDASGLSHILLVSPDPHAAGAEALARAVTAPRVSLNSTAGFPPGHYAWWAGDEGVKARANVTDVYADDNSADALLRRTASAQRPVIEAMSTTGNDGMAPFYPANHPEFDKLTDISDFNFLVPDPAHEAQLSARFHDLTLHSRGVLADVKNGGLKRDLSYVLGQPNIAALRNAVVAIYGSAAATSSASNRIISENITPLAAIPTSFSGAGDPSDPNENPGMFGYTPTWEQLWSFYNMGNRTTQSPSGVMNTSGEAVPRHHTRDQHGIHPITVQAKLFYRLRVNPASRLVSIDVRPLVVLANPYAVPLAAADYTIGYRFRHNPPIELRFGEEYVDPPNTGIYSDVRASLAKGGIGEMKLTLQSDGIPAGEALIFTLRDDGIVIPSSAADQANQSVILVNDFNPTNYLTYPTGVILPDPDDPNDPSTTHATLYMAVSEFEHASLYLDYSPAAGDRRLLQAVDTWTASQERGEIFPVFPTQSTTEGGGYAYHLFDYGPRSGKQHSLFLQQNYRTNIINGFHGWTGPPHQLQWARGHAKQGSPGNQGYFNAHLIGLTDPAYSFTNVRWGPINSGLPNSSYETGAPAELGARTGFQNLLYDIPSSTIPLSSLGQLQHLNVNGFIDASTWRSFSGNHATYGRNHQRALTVQSWQSNYTLSNSYANPRVVRHRIIDRYAPGFHYDGSYIWNHILWDRFYFSTYPASGNFDFNTDRLVNARYRPFRKTSEVALDDESAFRGTVNSSDPANSRMAAQNLMSEGAFNINSTSREAWKVFFSGIRNVPIGSENDPDNLLAPFSRTLQRIGATDQAETANHENAWNGFRALSREDINVLADEMVLQVQLRGPFLSLADFVNRRLVTRNNDPFNLGVSGALQSAIDSRVNHSGEVDSIFRINTSTHVNHIAEPEYRAKTVMDGFPGFLLQGDVLSATGPHITARSDTFRVRAYGDVTDEAGNSIIARAWCEAIVQRIPDYLASSTDPDGNHPHESPTNPVNEALGRRYRILSFRWLTPEEI